MLELLKRLLQTEHRFATRNLSAYLDGELRAAEKAQVERHLQGCAECRQDLATLRQTVDLLQLMPEMPLPRSFLVPATESARQAARQPAPAFFALRTASAIATTLLVLVFSGNLLLSRLSAPASFPLMTSAPVSQTGAVADSPRVAEAAAPQAASPLQPTSVAALLATPAKSAAADTATQAAPQPTANLERAVTTMKAAPSTAPMAAPMIAAAPSVTPASDVPPALPAAAGAGAPVLTSSAMASPTAAASETGEKAAVEKSQGGEGSGMGSRDNATTDTAGAPAGAPESAPLVARPDVRALLNGAMWMLLIATLTLWAVTAALHRQQR